MFLFNPLKEMVIVSPFGLRTHPVTKQPNSFHSGVDLVAKYYTPIYAVADGRIMVSKVNGGGVSVGYGYYMVVQHEGFCVLYAHLCKLTMSAGETVKAGQLIGYTGATGRVTGPHLHFEVRMCEYSTKIFETLSTGMKYKAVDPSQYFVKEADWERIIRKCSDSPEAWIKRLKDEKDSLYQWIPKLITNAYEEGKRDR